jgi:hypothetical protein
MNATRRCDSRHVLSHTDHADSKRICTRSLGRRGADQRIAHHLIRGGHRVEVLTIRRPASLPATEAIDGVTVRRFETPLPAATPASVLSFGPRAARGLLLMRR